MEVIVADCLWCGRHIPPDVDGEYCSTRCALLDAQGKPLPDEPLEGW